MMRATCNCCGNFNLFGARLQIIKKGGVRGKAFSWVWLFISNKKKINKEYKWGGSV